MQGQSMEGFWKQKCHFPEIYEVKIYYIYICLFIYFIFTFIFIFYIFFYIYIKKTSKIGN